MCGTTQACITEAKSLLNTGTNNGQVYARVSNCAAGAGNKTCL